MRLRATWNLFKLRNYQETFQFGALRHSHHYDEFFRPGKIQLRHKNLLPLVRTCNNLVLTKDPESQTVIATTKTKSGDLSMAEEVVPFFVADKGAQSQPTLFAYLRPCVVEALKNHRTSPAWKIHNPGSALPHRGLPNYRHVALVSPTKAWNSDFHELVSTWRNKGLFSDILSHWSNEPCPAFWPSNPEKESAVKKVAFSIERAALPLFSLPNYGVLLIAYTRSEMGELKLWVPRRSPTKKTFPGLLDVTVGGGIALNQTATAAIIRECTEEASFDEATVRKYISQTGVMHYHNRSPKGWLLPGHYTLFTLPLPSDIRPKLNHDDGEVDSFSLMSVEDVLGELEAGAFKPSSALAYVRFLIQQGKIDQYTEKYFDTIRGALEASPSPVVT